MTLTLAVDCGGSGTDALLLSGDGEAVTQLSAPPLNFHTHGAMRVALGIASLASTVTSEGRAPGQIALAVAGVRTTAERNHLTAFLRSAGIGSPLFICSDSEAALRAGGLRSGIVLVAGTGSSAYAKNDEGREARAGGWGAVLGDEGSGFWLGKNFLASLIRGVEEGEDVSQSLQETLHALHIQNIEELRSLAGSPDATARIAGLAPLIEGLRKDNALSRSVMASAAPALARLARVAADHVQLSYPRHVILAGGLWNGIPDLLIGVQQELGCGYSLQRLDRSPTWGVYWLGREADSWSDVGTATLTMTEMPDPLATDIADLDTLTIMERINDADAEVPVAVRMCLPDLARLADITVTALKDHGRLIYVGAGTSGRLAMLDAVECAPTFGLEPGRVMALVAGGVDALTHAVEGAEDNAEAGHRDVLAVGVCSRDVVVGVSASGAANYVIAALAAAQSAGATTAFVTCNPLAVGGPVDVRVMAPVGPEVIAGSTRMKAGTAQKLILNAFSTAVMIRLGRTRGNLMTSVRPTNAKLRARAVRLVMQLAHVDEADARAALDATEWRVEDATALSGGRLCPDGRPLHLHVGEDVEIEDIGER